MFVNAVLIISKTSELESTSLSSQSRLWYSKSTSCGGSVFGADDDAEEEEEHTLLSMP